MAASLEPRYEELNKDMWADENFRKGIAYGYMKAVNDHFNARMIKP